MNLQCEIPSCVREGKTQDKKYPLVLCEKHSKSKRDTDWFGRRWLEFRVGYSTYLIFMFGFSNFLLILYNFFPNIKDMVGIEIFAPLILLIIIPCAVFIGHIHNKKQFPIETRVHAHLNPYIYKIIANSKEQLNITLTISHLGILEHLARTSNADDTIVESIIKLKKQYNMLLLGEDSRDILK